MAKQTVNIAQKRRQDKGKKDMISRRNLIQNFKNLLEETRNSKDIEKTVASKKGKSSKRFPNSGVCNLELIILRDINEQIITESKKIQQRGLC